ncbi:hypothetical protein AMV003 [Betaentomopoxvirus amoorei]|uniref:AMV003 n=1 Tax=Amsacta moorei entomopoxvirus TaxID=28321 RepID=Q9EN43_AMEPV|nr:hypothetical protein AMV003 [Amsacta moorei entomopoxvirus]AAG02709.1 AMV003 [Amsacta moorei entomopoxvirus]
MNNFILFFILCITTLTKTENLHTIISDCIIDKFNTPRCNNVNIYNKYINLLKNKYDYDNKNDLKNLKSLLNLFNNLQYYNSYNKDEFISYILSYQIYYLNKHNKIIKRENIIEFNNVIVEIIDCYVRFKNLHFDNIKKDISIMQELFNKFPIWFTKNDYIIKIILYFYKNVRKHNNNVEFRNIIDNNTLSIIKTSIDYPGYIISEKVVKEIFYIEYVSHIIKDEQQKFNNYYNIINKEDVLPNIIIYNISNITIELRYDSLDAEIINFIKKESSFVYNNFIYFHKYINLPLNLKKDKIYYYIFNNKNQYEKYGLIYNIRTNNGGYTTIMDNKIQSFAYMQNNKPLNFGHELHHALMYMIYDMKFPIWFIEGSANAYGNRKCYELDLSYIKKNNFTIKDVLKSDYNTPNPYYMGSSLTRFLFDHYPNIIKKILTHQYNHSWIKHNHDIEFNIWRQKNIEYCEKNFNTKTYKNHKNPDYIKNKYLNKINKYSDIFKTFCNGNIIVEFYDEKEQTFILNKNNIYILTEYNNNKYIYNYNNISFVKNIDNIFPIVNDYDYQWINYNLLEYIFKNELKTYKYSKYILFDSSYSSYSCEPVLYCDGNKINKIPIKSQFYNYICDNNIYCIENEYILKDDYIKNILNNNKCDYNTPTVPLIDLPKNILKLLYDINMGNDVDIKLLNGFNLNNKIDINGNNLCDISIKYNNLELYNYIKETDFYCKYFNFTKSISYNPHVCKHELKKIQNNNIIVNINISDSFDVIIKKEYIYSNNTVNNNNVINKIINVIYIQKSYYIFIFTVIMYLLIIISIIFLLYTIFN